MKKRKWAGRPLERWGLGAGGDAPRVTRALGPVKGKMRPKMSNDVHS